MSELITVVRRRQAGHLHPRLRGARALGRPHRALRHPRDLRGDQASTGRRCSSSTPAARPRCCSRSCGASTTTVCRSRSITARSTSASAARVEKAMETATACAPSSHLDARPRHRLGRRRSRRPCRRAEGRQPAGPAHRPRQPPPGRAVAGDPRAGQPLRGAGVPRRARRQLSRRAGHAAAARPARSTCSRSTCSACACGAPFDADELYRGGAQRRALSPTSTARPSTASSISSRPAAMRCSTYERYATHPPDHGRPVAHRQSARRPAIPAERRHHRRDADAQRPLRPRHGRRHGGARRPGARQDRGVFPRDAGARRHLPLRRQDRCASRASARTRLRLHAHRRRSPRSRSMPAASSRSRPILAEQRARHAGRSRRAGSGCPSRSPTGCACSRRSRCCRGATTCWSRPFRAAHRYYMVSYPFEGRLAHQTLGMLLTRRLERAGARPLGFVATDYSLAVWALGDLGAHVQARQAVARRAVRRGHARRRSRGLAGRKLAAEAHLPQLRADLRADREAPSRQGEDRPAGHRLVRPRSTTCCAATSPTTSCCRRRGPTPRSGLLDVRPAGRHALAHPRPNRA